MEDKGIKSYFVDGQTFDIKESDVTDFLKDFPSAKEVVSFKVGSDTLDIDVSETESFLKEVPNAQKIYGGAEKKNPNGNDLPIGGKVGASETPSTGNEVAGLLGVKPIKPNQYAVPSPLVEETKTIVEPVESKIVKPQAKQDEDEVITKWGGAIKIKKGVNPNYVKGYTDIVYDAIQRGINQGETATALNISEGGGDIDVNQIAELQKNSQKFQPTAGYKKFNEAKTTGEALSALAEHPVDILSELSFESISAMMNHGIVGGRLWQPAVVGAGVGSVVPGLGTAAGAGSGFIAGTGLTSLNLEYSGKILESLQEEGVDTTSPDSLKKAFTDEKKFAEVRESALKKGIPIALFDMISAGVAGKVAGILPKKILGSILAGKVAGGAAEVGVQSALGGGGELVGEVVAGEKINPAAILAEMIGEPAGSVHEIAIGTMIEQAKDGKVSKEAINNAVANPSVDNQSIKEVVDVAVNTGQVTPEVAEQINKQVDVAEEINKTIPTQIQNDQDRAKAINLIEQRKEVETAMESVDEAFKPALKERIDAINSELTDLANKPQPAQEATIEETPTFETDQTEAAQPIELSTEVANQPQRETEAPTGNYEIAQEATKVVSEENPDASVLLTPKGEDLSLTAVFVKNEKRNKGVGTKVLESVKRQADKLGKKVVLDATTELDEETDLERLGNFYERNGFEKIGENKYQYTPKGQEEKVNPALNDVEGTAKALEDIDKTKWNEVSKLSPLKQGAYKERSDLHSAIAEAYHADKSAGKETELTKAVEQLLTPNTNQNEQETINAESEKSSNESPRDENGQQTQEENVSEEAKPKPYAEAFAEIEKAKRSKKIPSEKTKAAKEAVKALGKIGQDALFIDENFDTISKRLTNDKKVKFERIC